jgi:Fe-S cluster assembly ATP-binding protein
MALLQIKNLHAEAAGKPILRGLDLEVEAGQVCAIMGPNGSGKSTLANVLAGRPGVSVTAGEILYRGRDLRTLAPEERAREGIFLGFQYPVEIPGVANTYFLRAALNAVRKHRGEEPLDPMDFLALVKQKAKTLGLPAELLGRPVNDGFSGGEKKRNEILQMSVLEPRLAILDETDSGLDIDALREVARAISALRGPDRAIVAITHHQRLLDHLVPDRVYVLSGGVIVASGDKSLAVELEKHGYGWAIEQAGAQEAVP